MSDSLYNNSVKQNLRLLSFYFLLPLLLLVVGCFSLLNYLKAQEFGVLSLDARGAAADLVATRSGELLKGDKVWGTFHSSYPNLGLLSVRFHNGDRDSQDTLLFRFREKGRDEWYYQAEYKTDQFLPHKHFAFSFPPIQNSDDKNYEFQLESLNGATGSGILLDTTSPAFVARSLYTKTDLSKNRQLLVYFLTHKFVNVFGDLDILLHSLIFFLPFFLFITFLLSRGISYQFLSGLAISLILCDIFVLPQSYDFLFLAVLLLWGLISSRFYFDAKIAAFFALIFLCFTPITVFFHLDNLSQKTAIWAYLFLCIAVVQNIYEIKKIPQEFFSLSDFLYNFHKLRIPKNFWLKVIYRNFIHNTSPRVRFVVLLIIGLISRLSFLSLAVLLIYLPYLAILRVLIKFQSFYPSDYLVRYIFTLLLPEILLLFLFTILFVFFKRRFKKSSAVLIIILLLFNFFSRKVISKSIEFQNAPHIISITPNETAEAWTDVVITGKNFRNIPFVGKLFIDEVEQGNYMVYWSDEKIIFRTSPDLTKSGMIRVIPLDRTPSNKLPFKYNFR